MPIAVAAWFVTTAVPSSFFTSKCGLDVAKSVIVLDVSVIEISTFSFVPLVNLTGMSLLCLTRIGLRLVVHYPNIVTVRVWYDEPRQSRTAPLVQRNSVYIDAEPAEMLVCRNRRKT